MIGVWVLDVFGFVIFFVFVVFFIMFIVVKDIKLKNRIRIISIVIFVVIGKIIVFVF